MVRKMSNGPLPDGAFGEFASTFKEWHYFAGGAAIGFIAGAEYARRFHTDA